MTVEQLVKDGQLQCDVLEAVLDREGLRASKPCIVLVVGEEQTQCRLLLQELVGKDCANSFLMPLLGVALAEVATRVMKEEAVGLEAMGKFYGLACERKERKAGIGALLAALGKSEQEGDVQ